MDYIFFQQQVQNNLNNYQIKQHIIDNTTGNKPYETSVPPGYRAFIIESPLSIYSEGTKPVLPYQEKSFNRHTSTAEEIKEVTSVSHELQKDIAVMQKDIAVIKNDISYLKEDIKELNNDMKSISTEKLPTLVADVATIKTNINNMNAWIKGLGITISGTIIAGLILKLFEIFAYKSYIPLP